MNTTAATHTTNGTPASHAGSRTQPAQGHGRAGQGQGQGQAGGDLFSNLLMLLNSTRESSADDLLCGAGDAAGAAAGGDPALAGVPSADNPLAALPGWPAAAPLAAAALAGASPNGAGGLRSEGRDTPASLGASRLAGDTSATAALGRSGDGPRTDGDPSDAQIERALLDAAREPAQQAATTATAAARSARPVPAWRPTVGAPGAAGAPSASHALVAGGNTRELPAHQLLQAGQSAGVRSTVALGERSSPVRDAEVADASAASGGGAPVGAAGGGSATGSQSGPGSDGQPAGTGWTAEAEQPSESTASQDPRDLPTWPSEAGGGDADTPAGGQWAAAPLRHASLRVGEDGQDSIDIQLNLSGQELRLDFRSDNADVRASLAENAAPSLGELLQRSGIELADVSVGAQTPDGGHPPPSRQPGSGPAPLSGGRAARSVDEAPEAAATPVRPRSDGSRPLDLFA
jgi:hypothetical protein